MAKEDNGGAQELPVIHAEFECVSGGWTGSTHAPVKRVVKNDDGSFTVVIDFWPMDDPTIKVGAP